MKKIILLVLLIFIASLAYGDTITLKDRRVIEGKVVLLNPEVIQIKSGAIKELELSYASNEEIEKFEKEMTEYPRNEVESVNGKPLSPILKPEIDKDTDNGVTYRAYSIDKVRKEVLDCNTPIPLISGKKHPELQWTCDCKVAYYNKDGMLTWEGWLKICEPYNGFWTVFNESGKPHQIKYKDGLVLDKDGNPKNGLLRIYRKDGSLVSEGGFKEGKPYGVTKYFRPNGHYEVYEEPGIYSLYDKNNCLIRVYNFLIDDYPCQ